MDWHKDLRSVRALPVIVIDDLDDAVPLCRALAHGGLRLLEITRARPPRLRRLRAWPRKCRTRLWALAPSQMLQTIAAPSRLARAFV
jgi:2-keto-3-deoxy-6-phosphogluconate aldolase